MVLHTGTMHRTSELVNWQACLNLNKQESVLNNGKEMEPHVCRSISHINGPPVYVSNRCSIDEM